MAKPSAPNCTWQAIHDFMPPSPARLRVTGECAMPTPGYKLSLTRATPQGINPQILILDLAVEPPSGIVSQVVTTIKVRYDETTNQHYDSVMIQPLQVTVPVREVQ